MNCSVLLRCRPWNTPGISASCRLAKPENSFFSAVGDFCLRARWQQRGAWLNTYGRILKTAQQSGRGGHLCKNALYFNCIALNWQGHIRSGQGCLSVLLCCFSLRVRLVTRRSSALQATQTAAVWLFHLQQVWFRHFQGSGTGRTKRTPIDDDAENAEIRPLEACIPLSI